ncbi:MAG: BsaWI family type II restriction enzyme [Endomicrobium sp.]|jgi:type II restriction enzyme|nr:BsaWI family type II restriction enzyme [Endomicrobium sp.]
MEFKDLVSLYEDTKKEYGNKAYRYISKILSKAKEQHLKDFFGDDHEQSWRAFKGKNLEKLIEYIIISEIESIGLKTINGNTLERKFASKMSDELAKVKRNLSIDYGKFGLHLPDVDIVIYNPNNSKVIAVLSIKVTLRERIAQTGYWKLKLSEDNLTKNVKVYFITLDEDQTLRYNDGKKKGKAIVEIDTDGGYVLSEHPIEETDKVKTFDKFIEDLKKTINER